MNSEYQTPPPPIKTLILFNQIFVWKSLKIHMFLPCIRGIYFKPHASLVSINGNIKESLTWIEGFWQESAIFNALKSRDSPLWSSGMLTTWQNKVRFSRDYSMLVPNRLYTE